jgi:hypothetical protein
MSTLQSVGIILSTAVVAYIGVIYGSAQLGKLIDAVLTGIVEGVQVSAKQRTLKLFIMYLSQLGAIVGINVIVSFGFAQIGNSVSDAGVRTLAYLCSGVAAFGALSWLFLGPLYLVYCVRALRQAEAD